MRLAVIALAALTSFNANGLAQQGCAPAIERAAYLMGTTLRTTICTADRESAIAAIEAGFAEVRRLETVLSSWQPNSQIGRVNTAPANAQVPITTELAALLKEASHWVAVTNGAFDPAIGALIDVWGFRAQPRVPARAEINAALTATGWSRARVDSVAIVHGPSDWWIDTGGFGKGAALRSFANILRERGVREAVIDFGGQLQIIGAASAVSIAHPQVRKHATTTLRLRDVSVATTSQSERYIEADGKRYGHVLDPRTGHPVEAWGSVTVVMEDALAADALSTALFVMGPEAALQWAKRHPDVGVLVLESGTGEVRATWSRAMDKWIEETD
ncbi:MAG: FAD:protein FMN transferase [Gemmatimonadota bacterium]